MSRFGGSRSYMARAESPARDYSRMPNFRSWLSYRRFAESVLRERRYIHTPQTCEFLDAVAATIPTLEMAEGHPMWRAQRGHNWGPMYPYDSPGTSDVPWPFSKERMKPRNDRAYEGRANPKGMPVLYASNNRETAMSEVRPWIGAWISVAGLKLVRDVKVVKCLVDNVSISRHYDEEPEDHIKTQVVWSHIDRAFAEPVARGDDVAEYAPTQIVAELFKSMGFDGVLYRSAFGSPGYNVALFDLGCAEVNLCSLFEVKSVNFSFQDLAATYFIKREIQV
jgi:hypothetical protein